MPTTLSHRMHVAWCRTCNARDRLHRDGRCVVCGSTELHPCLGCGRPLAGSDRYCSDGCLRADELPGRPEAGDSTAGLVLAFTVGLVVLALVIAVAVGAPILDRLDSLGGRP